MAAISKRATGYQAQIRRKGYPTISKAFGTKREAEAWARHTEAEMDRGIYLDKTEAENTSFGDLLTRYLAEITPQKKGARNETILIRRFLRDEKLCQYKSTLLTGMLLSKWRDRRLQEVSGSTVNRELNLISHVINIARKEWGIHLVSNPVEMIRRPREGKARQRRLHADEEQRLLDGMQAQTKNPWLMAIVLFALETGMRRGEILSLQWADVDLASRLARLNDTKNGEARSVPLTTKARELLSGLPRSIDGRVFATTAEAVKQGFARALIRAKIEDFRFHDLRHEAISRLFEKGLNVMEVSAISGHKTLQMLKRYTHLSCDGLLSKIG